MHTFGKYKYTLLYHNGERSLKTAHKNRLFGNELLKQLIKTGFWGFGKQKQDLKKQLMKSCNPNYSKNKLLRQCTLRNVSWSGRIVNQLVCVYRPIYTIYMYKNKITEKLQIHTFPSTQLHFYKYTLLI